MRPSGARTTSVASTVTSTSCRQEPAPEADGDAGRHPDAQDGILSVSTPVAPPQQRKSAAHQTGRRQAGPVPQGSLIVAASLCARRARCVPSSCSSRCASVWANPAAPTHRRRSTPCRLACAVPATRWSGSTPAPASTTSRASAGSAAPEKASSFASTTPTKRATARRTTASRPIISALLRWVPAASAAVPPRP